LRGIPGSKTLKILSLATRSADYPVPRLKKSITSKWANAANSLRDATYEVSASFFSLVAGDGFDDCIRDPTNGLNPKSSNSTKVTSNLIPSDRALRVQLRLDL